MWLLAALAVAGLLVGIGVLRGRGPAAAPRAQSPTGGPSTSESYAAPAPTPTPTDGLSPSIKHPDQVAARLTPVVAELMRAAMPRAEFHPSGRVAGPFDVYLDPSGYLVASANVRDDAGVGYVSLTIGQRVDPAEACG